MSDDLFPSRSRFQFRSTLIGRWRRLWHGVAGYWVETYHIEEQDRINKRLNRQQLDLAELVALQDREATQLKRMIADLAAELRQAHEQIALLKDDVAAVSTKIAANEDTEESIESPPNDDEA